MNIPDKAFSAADQAGDEAYAMGGAPEDVAKAAVRAAAPFIAAQALRDAAAQKGIPIGKSSQFLLAHANEMDPQ